MVHLHKIFKPLGISTSSAYILVPWPLQNKFIFVTFSFILDTFFIFKKLLILLTVIGGSFRVTLVVD